MTDTRGNTITASSTYYPVNGINNIQDSSEIAYNSAYKTCKDDTDSYNSATTPSGVTSYNPSKYDVIAAHTAYDQDTGALDEHYDYRLENGTMRHNLERRLPDGNYQLREVYKFDDGRAHVHLEYRNPRIPIREWKIFMVMRSEWMGWNFGSCICVWPLNLHGTLDSTNYMQDGNRMEIITKVNVVTAHM